MEEGKTILLDSNFLVYRAGHSSCWPLEHKGVPTGAIFGYLGTLADAAQYNKTRDFVHIFDSRTNKRKEIFPEYKEKRGKDRKEADEVTQEKNRRAFAQMDMLYKEILPEIGFSNVIKREGYEGDDLFASITMDPDYADEEFLMYASDADLYQLLRHGVSQYNPSAKKLMTLGIFRHTYELEPADWIKVKSIGGCRSDEVPGCMPGIAEGRAIKYLTGQLPAGSFLKKIESEEGKARAEFNRKLVELPFPGTPKIDLVEDQLDWDAFMRVCERLGFVSLLEEDASRFMQWRQIIVGDV